MAATTAIAERIDTALRALLAEVDDLPSVAAGWDALSEGNRASFALGWDHLMSDYLTEVAERFATGELSSPHAGQYRALVAKLRAALPFIERLNLCRPPAELPD
jgi:hypothetical protein